MPRFIFCGRLFAKKRRVSSENKHQEVNETDVKRITAEPRLRPQVAVQKTRVCLAEACCVQGRLFVLAFLPALIVIMRFFDLLLDLKATEFLFATSACCVQALWCCSACFARRAVCLGACFSLEPEDLSLQGTPGFVPPPRCECSQAGTARFYERLHSSGAGAHDPDPDSC